MITHLAFVDDLAGIGSIGARQDFHQGRFARAIFTDKPVDQARLTLNRHIPQRLHTGKSFGNAIAFPE